jgi:NADH:ubiquinone oxidoreductase subunit 5 (subunit L)/multisubunit Na+/H+ antiporter MnhA subunit
MAREFPLWVIVVLPWLGALGCLVLARPGARLLGSERARMLAHYLGLGASTLAMLFTLQAIQLLLAPEDPRALAHTPLVELIGPMIIGEVRIDATLIADRLSSSAALLISALFVLARMFVPGPAGQRALGLGSLPEGPRESNHDDATRHGLRRLALLGLLEGAALLFVLASDLGLAAIGWVLLGIGAVMAVARAVDDERRASAATRVLALGVIGDLGLGAAAIALVVSGIGLAHNNLWAPLTGDHLYAVAIPGLSFSDLIALLLLGAALARLSSLTWAGNSLAEALLDAVLIPVPAVYLLLRYSRVLSYAPSVLAGSLIVGTIVALAAAAIALARPEWGQARHSARAGTELGLAGTGLAWVGLVMIAIGVGAWRTAALLLLAHALGRLGLRLALLVADGEQLPIWTARIGRVLGWAVAGVAPGLGFVVLAQTLVDVISRNSLLAPWVTWPAGFALLLVSFMLAAAVARIWYEALGRKPGADVHTTHDEDGLDFAPLVVIVIALVGVGVAALGSWFGVFDSPLAWLDKILPLAGGHESAPIGLREPMRDGAGVARPWIAGSAVLVAMVTAFAWMWTRERFRRAHGEELSGLAVALESTFSWPRRSVQAGALLLTGLTELAARGIGRGGFEAGPRVARSLIRDLEAAVTPRLRGLSRSGGRQALLGVVVGFALVLAWLYAKPEVSSALPTDSYGFGGLRPRLIRAGGDEPKPSAAPESTASEPSPGSDAAEPAHLPSPEQPSPERPR